MPTAGCVFLLLASTAAAQIASRLFALPARISERAKLSLIYKPPNRWSRSPHGAKA
jgi:hypothetical protein